MGKTRDHIAAFHTATDYVANPKKRKASQDIALSITCEACGGSSIGTGEDGMHCKDCGSFTLRFGVPTP